MKAPAIEFPEEAMGAFCARWKIGDQSISPVVTDADFTSAGGTDKASRRPVESSAIVAVRPG